MKSNITLFLLVLFTLQLNAQEHQIYTESGTSFFLQVGPTDNLYSKLVSLENPAFVFNGSNASRIDRSISMGLALELVRGNVGFRLQTNRINIDETFEIRSSITDNSFGQFTSESSSIIRGKQINYEIIPGIHRYFQINKWLFTGGIEAPFTIYDIFQYSQIVENKFTSSTSGFSFDQETSDETTGELPGGYDVGIGANLGLQHAFNNTVKIAIQYSPSIRHYKIGGESDFTRKNKQRFVEQFENEPPNISESNMTVTTTNSSTQSEIADFRQKMNFAFILSF